jgi:pimeloyl-ACP methyl ester carboxylesterase
MQLRPLWDDAKLEDLKNWHPLSDDLLRFLSDFGPDSVIGVGHSIGATTTLRAALRAPGKFRALVLIEPVLFTPGFMMFWQMARMLGLVDMLHPLIPIAKKRRRKFDDLDTVFNGYRKRDIFRYMSDESLRAYIEGMTQKTELGYELAYSADWEAHIYRTSMQDFDIWRRLPQLKIPVLVFRGAETDTFWESAAKHLKQIQPKARIETLPKSTHLVPLEYPKEVFGIMQSFLKEVI